MSSSRPRLLYVFNESFFFVSHRLAVALLAQRAGYDVHVATPPGDSVARITAAGLPHHPIALDRSSRNVLRELRALLSLWRLYRDQAPDLVENATIKPVLYGSLILRFNRKIRAVNWLTGLGHVFASHDFRSRVLRRVVTTIYRLGLMNPRSRTLFENPDNRDLLVASGAVSRELTAVILGSGVNMTDFAERPEPPGRPVVMLASRMLWTKGVGEFVEMARRLRAAGTDADFVLVGAPDPSNPESVSAEQLAEWKQRGDVDWWGHRTDMSEVLSRCTIFCLPSAYGEGLPRVLIEVAATGRAIVATDIPGCREVCRDGVNGILIPPRDPEALTRAVASLLSDPEGRRRMGAASRQLARTELSVERCAEQTLALYASLLAS